jgi:hypothetical protein
MPRLQRLIKGTRYQVGRFAGSWYVVDLDHLKFIYGPFTKRGTAESRLKRLPGRIGNPITRRKAKTILHEGRAHGHKLTKKQRAFFGARASGYPRKNPGRLPTPRISRYSKTRVNPRKGVLIYGRVLKIYAQKTTGRYRGQRFVHTFKRGALMVGMPDGSLRIVHP